MKKLGYSRRTIGQWVNALRSGKYKQTVHAMYDGRGYCPLGVLCKITKTSFKKFTVAHIAQGMKCDNEINQTVYEKLDQKLSRNGLESTKLVFLNDFRKLSFLEIADYIQEELLVNKKELL